MRISASNFRLLPVYTTLQDQHRTVCGDGCNPVLQVYSTAYPPFQLKFDTDQGIPSSVRLKKVCADGVYETNWANTCVREELDLDQDTITEWWYTFGGGFFIGVPAGTYYVEIEFPDDIFLYTEVFYHPGDCRECKDRWYLEYSHTCDEKSLGKYSTGFLNTLYLGDIIIYPDGSVESKVSRKDGFGIETIIATDKRPRNSFEILGTPWLLESLDTLNLYDNIYLKRVSNGESYKLENVTVESKGDTTDCNFPIKLTFTKDYLVNTKCCDSIYEQAPIPSNCAGMSVMTSDDFQICLGDTVDLMAVVIGGSQPFVFIWSTGETGDTITVSPTETTTYVVTAVDAFGCVKQDTVTITVIECTGDFLVEISADPSPSCPGESVDLDATVTGGTGPFTYLWSTGATTEDITVSPLTTTVYSLQVTDTFDMSIVMENITVIVNNAPDITIQVNQCNLSLAQVDACEEASYEWQVEGPPDTWTPAPGINNGTSYYGLNGQTYRLQIICDGCTGISNEETAECPFPCQVTIDSVSFDDDEDELTVNYTTILGSTPFIAGMIVLYESLTPVVGDCAASGDWSLVMSVTLMSETGSVVIPFTPTNNPGCILIGIGINANECGDDAVFAIPTE